MFNIIYSCTNLFVLSAYQFILFYFFKEIISCFIFIYKFKFVTHIFKVFICFQLNQEFLISQLIIILKYFFIFIFALFANNRKKDVWYFRFFRFSILAKYNTIKFFHLFVYWKYFNIILSFLSQSLGENRFV